jgi:hypothetical protein
MLFTVCAQWLEPGEDRQLRDASEARAHRLLSRIYATTPVIRRLADAQLSADLLERSAPSREGIGLPQLENDLLRGVAGPFHLENPFCPSRGGSDSHTTRI